MRLRDVFLCEETGVRHLFCVESFLTGVSIGVFNGVPSM